MAEGHRHARLGAIGQEADGLDSVFLECPDVLGHSVAQRIESHVQQSERHLAHTGIGGVERAQADNFVNQRLRYRLARLVVEGKRVEELRLCGEIFHELRGQFHEVPIYVRAA